MTYVAFNGNIIGHLCKEETTYGSAIAVAGATDGVQPYFTDRSGIPVNMSYLWDGTIGPAPGNDGNLRRGVPFGGAVTYDLPFYFKGGGAAYSASVVPLIHKMWKACGLTATVDVTGGAEKWTYNPTAVGTIPTSLTQELYTEELKIPLTGVLGNWKFSGDTSGPLKHTFSLSGIKGTVARSAASVPAAFVYPLTSIVPPSPVGSSLTIGSYTGVIGIKSVDFDLGRKLEARPGMDAADGHLGFIHRGRDPVLKVAIEQAAFATTPFHAAGQIDPWELYESGNSFVCSFQHAGAQYNKFLLTLTQATMSAPPEKSVVNGAACITLEIRPYVSTPIANDDIVLVTA